MEEEKREFMFKVQLPGIDNEKYMLKGHTTEEIISIREILKDIIIFNFNIFLKQHLSTFLNM